MYQFITQSILNMTTITRLFRYNGMPISLQDHAKNTKRRWMCHVGLLHWATRYIVTWRRSSGIISRWNVALPRYPKTARNWIKIRQSLAGNLILRILWGWWALTRTQCQIGYGCQLIMRNLPAKSIRTCCLTTERDIAIERDKVMPCKKPINIEIERAQKWSILHIRWRRIENGSKSMPFK